MQDDVMNQKSADLNNENQEIKDNHTHMDPMNNKPDTVQAANISRGVMNSAALSGGQAPLGKPLGGQSAYGNACNSTVNQNFANSSYTANQNSYHNHPYAANQNAASGNQSTQGSFINTQNTYRNQQNISGYSYPYQQNYQTGQSAGYNAAPGHNTRDNTYYGNYKSASGNAAVNGSYNTGNSANGFTGNAAANKAEAVTNPAISNQETRKLEKEKKKAEKKEGTFRKIALSGVYGLVFGLIAGLAFFAVKEVGNRMGLSTNISDNTQVEEVPSADEEEILSSESDNSTATESPQSVINSSDVVQTNNATTVVALDDVSSVVDKVMPSIVSVINSYTADYYYFSEEEESSGSGIIIGSNDDELLVVTNYHVIQGNDSLKVIFCDEAEAMAQVKGQDKEMDLAVIAIPLDDISADTKKSISIATMGDSDNLKVGETAIAIGNSLGFGQSVSKGIISAVNREMDMNGVKGTFIQTDAAINPGNSGGALLNINGEVIGINSNKIGGDAVEGMGYAIPITAAKPILEDLMIKETKKLAEDDKQSYLGISGANITSQEQAFYGYPDGIYVANVYEDTAAEQAGLQKGDFIVTFDGEEVSSMEDLQKLLLYYEAGTTVDIEIYRPSPAGYQQMTITVTLGNRSDMKD